MDKMTKHGTIAVVLFLTLTMHAGAQNATPATPEVLRVTRYADDRNEGSLRWAIEQSNWAPGRWRIEIVANGTPPYVIKPVNEGSSVGIYIIRKGDNRPPAELGSDTWTLSDEMMVEEFVPGRELELRIQFRTDVFDVATIEALIERFKRVLVAMTADPSRRLSTSDLLDGGEHARLDGWGNRAVLTEPTPPAVSIPAVFAEQVARAPEEVAVA